MSGITSRPAVTADALDTVDPWSRVVFKQKVLALLEDRMFNISNFDQLARSLKQLRQFVGAGALPEEKMPQYAALRALHCDS